MNKYAVLVGHDGNMWSSAGFRVKANGSGCARLMKSILQKAGFSSQNMKVLTNKNATQSNVLDALNWLSLVESTEDEVVLFFGGHGGSGGIGLQDGGISHRTIKDLGLQSQKQLIVVDTCGSAGAILPGADGVELSAPNRIVLTSTKSEAESSPCTKQYTVWAEGFLLNGISRCLADSDGDGSVSIQDAFRYCSIGLLSDNYGQEFFL